MIRTMDPKERIVFALNLPNIIEAERFIKLLGGDTRSECHVGAFKVGLELFMGAGLAVVRMIKRPVMLDLKLHDIPETVERAILRAGDLGVSLVTLHVQQRETLRRAVKAADRSGIQLLGVTVLTSMDAWDMHDLQLSPTDPTNRACYLAQMAWKEGVTGFVASPMEVARLHAELPKATLVIPGIRPAGANAGDQKRIGTPAQAVRDGADLLVIGRPIRDAIDPVAAAGAIATEIDGAPRTPEQEEGAAVAVRIDPLPIASGHPVYVKAGPHSGAEGRVDYVDPVGMRALVDFGGGRKGGLTWVPLDCLHNRSQ